MIGMRGSFREASADPRREYGSVIVTISNLYGCGALAVARELADELRYVLVDEQLPVVVAKRLQTSPQSVESAEDASDTVGGRVLRALGAGTPELGAASGVDFSKECLREVQDAVREFSAHGEVVIVGRGAGFILGRRHDVLRVFMYAPHDWRVTHIADGLGVSREVAAAEIDRVDRGRKQYIETHYGVSWIAAQNYDLCLDTSSISVQGAAAVIARAVRAR